MKKKKKKDELETLKENTGLDKVVPLRSLSLQQILVKNLDSEVILTWIHMLTLPISCCVALHNLSSQS